MTSLAIGLYIDEGADRISASVDRLLAHTSLPFRLVLLGDGPDPATRHALQGLSRWEQSVTEEPKGPAACFDRLTRLHDVDFYVLLEGGALPGPGWFGRMLFALERMPHCGIAGPSTNFASTLQCLVPSPEYADADPAQMARTAARRFGSQSRTLGPTQSLGDFCYVVRRAVVEAIGDADDGTGADYCWEAAHHDRARRAGFASLWVCGAYVHRPLPATRRTRRARSHEVPGAVAPARIRSGPRNHSHNGVAIGPQVASLPTVAGDLAQSAAAVLSTQVAAPRNPPPPPPPPRPAGVGNIPLASCIMPTCNRRKFIPRALRCFFAQDYANLELVIIDDGSDPIHDLLPADPRIRYIRLPGKQSIGTKRNLACAEARGEFILHWDDDDWSPHDRVSRQIDALRRHGAEITGTSTVFYYCESTDTAYRYQSPALVPIWMAGLAYRRRAWQQHPFEPIEIAEDVKFLMSIPPVGRVDLRAPDLYVAFIHEANAAPKDTSGSYWARERVETLRAVAGDNLILRQDIPAPQRTRTDARPLALVTAASGIGDIIRVTPLIRVLDRMGFRTDLLLAPDDPAVAKLFRGAPELHRIVLYRDLATNRGSAPVAELSGIRYDIATFTTWSAPLARWIDAEQHHTFVTEQWLIEGDSPSVERIARSIGWQGALPPPFAIPSRRDFTLAPGTIALHPGCKPGWPWKKWHGFDELARLLPHVVIVGTEADVDNAQTYFRRSFEWPAHAQNFVGRLCLADTAALISQCAALVANDSGLMHLGVALGVPTFGVFGITSQQREGIPSPWMTAISKGLSCEPACRRQAWGRRDCEHHLECLRTLTPAEVLSRIAAKIPAVAAPPRPVALDGRSTATEGTAVAVARREPEPRPSEQLTVAIILEGGLGDVLIGARLVEATFLDLEHCPIDVYFHLPDAAAFAFHDARFVRRVLATRDFAANAADYDMSIYVLQYTRFEVRDWRKLERVAPAGAERIRAAVARFDRYRRLFDRRPQLDGLWGRISVQNGRDVLSTIGYLSGLPIGQRTQLFLAPNADEFQSVRQSVEALRGRYITVHDGFDNTTAIAPGRATKCWPLEHWSALVGQIAGALPDVKIVQLGGTKSRPIPGVHVDLVGRTTLHQAAWIIKGALLHVDTDSGLVHLAHAVHTRSVVLFGPTDKAYYGYQDNLNIGSACCSNCWWSTSDWLAHCPRGLTQPECMTSIEPSMIRHVVATALAAYADIRCRVVFKSLYDGTRNRDDQKLLNDMFARLAIAPVPITRHAKDNVSGLYVHASKQWEYMFALRQIGATDGSHLKIADVGGGRGALAAFLATDGHAVDVFDRDYLWDHAGDTSIEWRYMKWAAGHGYRVRFGSLYNLPAADDSYDVVTCISVVEHIRYKDLVLKELLRIVRPGGLLILTFDFAADPRRFVDELRSEIFGPALLGETLAAFGLEGVGFEASEVEDSVSAIQRDGVLGIPDGMTVGGIVIRKESGEAGGPRPTVAGQLRRASSLQPAVAGEIGEPA